MLWDTMENRRIFTHLNKETKETINNLFENGIFILAIAQICGVHRTTVWRVIKGANRVQNKARWTQTEDFKAVR